MGMLVGCQRFFFYKAAQILTHRSWSWTPWHCYCESGHMIYSGKGELTIKFVDQQKDLPNEEHLDFQWSCPKVWGPTAPLNPWTGGEMDKVSHLELRLRLRNHVWKGAHILWSRNGECINERGVHGVLQNWVKGVGSLVLRCIAVIKMCDGLSRTERWELTRYLSRRLLQYKIHRRYHRTRARSQC